MRAGSVRVRVTLAIMCASGAALQMSTAVGQSVVGPVPDFATDSFDGPQIPPEVRGAWQAQVEGKTFKLKSNFNIEVKFEDGRDGRPHGLVAYFAGDPRRPSSLCRSQLDLASNTDGRLVFTETLNYKSERRAQCPIWDGLAVEQRGGELWIEWQDVGRRSAKVKMQASAVRTSGGAQCRTVGGGGRYGGQVWCRDMEGNWAPQSR